LFRWAAAFRASGRQEFAKPEASGALQQYALREIDPARCSDFSRRPLAEASRLHPIDDL
jgi:hypothetical protein